MSAKDRVKQVELVLNYESSEFENEYSVTVNSWYAMGALRVVVAELFLGSEGVIYLNLVSEELIQKLNKQYREIDKPTDVLSFDIGHSGEIGELYVSPEYVKRTCGDYAEKFEVELLRVVVHGLLHLAGYDHDSEFDSSEKAMGVEMFALQEKILERVLKEK